MVFFETRYPDLRAKYTNQCYFHRLIGILSQIRICLMTLATIWDMIQVMHAQQLNHVRLCVHMVIAGIINIVNYLMKMNSKLTVSFTERIVCFPLLFD